MDRSLTAAVRTERAASLTVEGRTSLAREPSPPRSAGSAFLGKELTVGAGFLSSQDSRLTSQKTNLLWLNELMGFTDSQVKILNVRLGPGTPLPTVRLSLSLSPAFFFTIFSRPFTRGVNMPTGVPTLHSRS